MDTAVLVSKAAAELKGMVEAGTLISPEQHEHIQDSIIEMASDIDILNDYNEKYEYVMGFRKFAPIRQRVEVIQSANQSL